MPCACAICASSNGVNLSVTYFLTNSRAAILSSVCFSTVPCLRPAPGRFPPLGMMQSQRIDSRSWAKGSEESQIGVATRDNKVMACVSKEIEHREKVINRRGGVKRKFKALYG